MLVEVQEFPRADPDSWFRWSSDLFCGYNVWNENGRERQNYRYPDRVDRVCRASVGRGRPHFVSPLDTIDGFSTSVLVRGLVSFPSQESVERELPPVTKTRRKTGHSAKNLWPERAELMRLRRLPLPLQ